MNIEAIGKVSAIFSKLKGNVEQFKNETENMGLSGASSAEQLASSFKTAGESIASTGKLMTASLSVPIVGLGVASTKAAVDFEEAFTGVRKTVDTTEENFKKLSDGIKQMSTETASSKNQITGVMEVAGQPGVEVGKDGKNLLDFTRLMIQPVDVTAYARGMSNNPPEKEKIPPADWSQGKIYRCGGFDSHPGGYGREVLRVFDLGVMIVGAEELDLRGLHNIVSPRQLHALGFILRAIMAKNAPDSFSNPEKELDIEREVDEIFGRIESEGLDCIYSGNFPDMNRFIDLPRREEVMQAISRLRTLKCARDKWRG